MGYGTYSSDSRSVRATSLGYTTKSAHEIFKSRSINNAMNPNGIVVRESRDSKKHPNALPIIIALDVTGSMGTVPHQLVKDGLPTLVTEVIKNGQPDPQILFLAIGDHECDNSPLQVGQFESSDELLDKWLTDVYLEGGGGGNGGESYLLAWYFAGYHTVTDNFEKRKEKGFLFTIGDEPTLRNIPKRGISEIMGDGQYEDFSAAALLDKAKETYNVYHLHIKQTGAGQRESTIRGWRELMGENLVVIERHTDVANAIAQIVTEHCKKPKVSKSKESKKEEKVKEDSSEIIL